jgi:hypothetical protein
VGRWTLQPGNPGRHRRQRRSCGVGDLWVLRYRGTEIADGQPFTTDPNLSRVRIDSFAIPGKAEDLQSTTAGGQKDFQGCGRRAGRPSCTTRSAAAWCQCIYRDPEPGCDGPVFAPIPLGHAVIPTAGVSDQRGSAGPS